MRDLYSEESVGETAFCVLSAINVAKVSKEEYEHVAEVAVRTVDALIDKAPMMAVSMEQSIRKRRSVGVGITGLASSLYKQWMDYDGKESSLSYTSELAEMHYYYLLKASQKMSEESGEFAVGVDFNWLPVDTAVNEYIPKMDWEALRGKQRKHSVLVAHMPTESSAIFSGSSNGLYPIREKVINKKSRKGVVQYICNEWMSNKYAWDVDNITLSRYYGRIQDFTDQGISADYYFDPSKYPDEKKPLSELMREWVAQAKLGNKTQYYVNTRDFNGGGIQDQGIDCESCKL
jgi:ribonucleoside-diphosphate reductase alpha chain